MSFSFNMSGSFGRVGSLPYDLRTLESPSCPQMLLQRCVSNSPYCYNNLLVTKILSWTSLLIILWWFPLEFKIKFRILSSVYDPSFSASSLCLAHCPEPFWMTWGSCLSHAVSHSFMRLGFLHVVLDVNNIPPFLSPTSSFYKTQLTCHITHEAFTECFFQTLFVSLASCVNLSFIIYHFTIINGV